MLRRLIVVLMILSVAALSSTPASADGSCEHHNKRSGDCQTDGHDGPGKTPKRGKDGGHTPTQCIDSTFSTPPRTLPCSGPLGVWANEWQCYLKLYDGEPSDPYATRAYHCYSPPYAGGLDLRVVMSDAMPGTPVDPEAVARDVVVSLELHAIHMGLAPHPGSSGLVQLPVWMWAAQPDYQTWGPASASKTVQGLTVVVKATVDSVEWNMGDGTTLTCGVGTPRPAGGGTASSPDCGHTYTSTSASKASGAFTVTATSHWTINWTAGAQSGSFPFELSDTTQLTIIESRPVLTAP
jgi:hypothetical protein